MTFRATNTQLHNMNALLLTDGDKTYYLFLLFQKDNKLWDLLSPSPALNLHTVMGSNN